MTNYADVASDVEKAKAEGFKTEEEVKNWAMKHGYGLAQLDDFVADWAKDAPEEVVEEEFGVDAEREIAEEEEDEDEYDDEEDEDEYEDDEDEDEYEDEDEEVEEDPAPAKKSFWKK